MKWCLFYFYLILLLRTDIPSFFTAKIASSTQWSQEKVQKDKQRSTKHTYKSKDRVTRTPVKIEAELMCSGRVNEVVFILFLSYITVTYRHTIVFHGKDCFLNIKTSSKRL
jgi:hypothetical protein